MRNFFEKIGGMLIGLGIIALAIMLALLFIKGGLWFSQTLYPLMYKLTIVAFVVSFVILLPFSLFKKTKQISIKGLLIASFVFGIFTWMCAFIVSYNLWGYVGLFIGLFIGGVGVVPIAILATLFNGEWAMLLHIILLLIVTFGFRFLSFYIAAKRD